MSKTISDQVIEMLVEAGVTRCFGVPGDATDLMLASIHARDDIDFILTRHEEGAGFMVNAQAKLNGTLGVVLAAQGPGVAHMVNAMYDAKLDKIPMLVISGQVETHLIGTNTAQELDQMSLFNDAAAFNREVRSANNLAPILQLAIQMALVNRCVAHVSIATDVMREPAVKRPTNTAVFNIPYQIHPEPQLIEQAADILNSKKNVAILYGGGCLYAKDEVLKIAGLLNAPTVHTLRSKDVLDNSNPHYAGGIGLMGSRNGCHQVKNCDALLVIGSSYAWDEYYPHGVPIIQIDRDPERIGSRTRIELGLVGDAKLTLEQLIPLLTQKTDNSYLSASQKNHTKAIKGLDKKAEGEAKNAIYSPFVVSLISEHMTDDAIVTVDTGASMIWANNWLRLNGKQRMITSTELATLGFGMPAAIGCQFAEPDRQVIAICGDGGFQMSMPDFSTAVKYNLPIKIFILNNFAYHFIELEQMSEGVALSYTKLNNPDYAKLAEAFGGVGFTAKKPSEVEGVIRAALACDKPTIVDIHVDENELIIPNKITADMIMSFTKSTIKTKLSNWLKK
tara:strand:+ start:2921 stop:4609 length:1689 start_codon:yes stop_codon:yes gene_type:complete